MTDAALPFLAFLDLHPAEDAAAVNAAIARVVASGWYVLGPEVEAFEAAFAEASGAADAIGVANGTDALALVLRALGIGPGDEVIVPALTAAYTALAVLMAGARPVFADVDPERLTLDPGACAAAVTPSTAAILPVHLYGQPADLDALRVVAQRRGLAIVEDCCQAHLATCGGVPVGSTTAAGAFSFYPTKNLGALGDGGAVVTKDADLAARVRRLRNGGQTTRYDHAEPGVNSRLDELQAGVLLARLPYVPLWTERRRALARAYRSRLEASSQTSSTVPLREIESGHVYHLFPVRTRRRDQLQTHLREAGIETLIHYPLTLPQQPAFAAGAASRRAARTVASETVPAETRNIAEGAGRCPVAEQAARELLSLPLHPRLTEGEIQRVAEAICAFDTART